MMLHIQNTLKGGVFMSNYNKLVVPEAKQALDQMKAEIASEFGVKLGADTTARQNGSVGGEITKRLVKQAQASLSQTK